MKILVMSDSHGQSRLMELALARTKPNAVVFLGDGCDQIDDLQLEYDWLMFHIVGGNCDRAGYKLRRELLCYQVCGVMLYMTHGHNEGVKYSLGSLLSAARANNASAALYGHTHSPDCHREPDGLWVINPGSCSGINGSVAILEVNNGEITDCRILRQPDLEAMK